MNKKYKNANANVTKPDSVSFSIIQYWLVIKTLVEQPLHFKILFLAVMLG